MGVAEQRRPELRTCLPPQGGRGLIRRFNLLVNVMILRDTGVGSHPRGRDGSLPRSSPYARSPPRQRRPSGRHHWQPRVSHRCRRRPDRARATLHTYRVADGDVAFGSKERVRLEARLPIRTTVMLHGVGHFLQSDAPEDLGEAIRDWWGQAGRPTQRVRGRNGLATGSRRSPDDRNPGRAC
jgi:haloalkane dehalogenase